ncbi:MAG TPA: hypothetical protein VEW28_04525 [Candidatus Kapabacteria bacterium]|nr:hypothetical protein [Candidatus Kapabacteria bacterium]
MKNYLLLLLFSSLALASCESTTQPGNNSTSGKGDRMFILDQGDFNHHNAHIDAQNWTTNTLTTDLIDPFGDSGNDLQYLNKKLYAVLDNSDKIVVINPDSTADHHSIYFPSGATPGKIVAISSTTAVVTDIYLPTMYVVNLSTDSVIGTFNVGAGQSWLAVLGGKLFATTESNEIISIDPTLKTVSKEKWIGENPFELAADSINNKLIVMTYGAYSPRTDGKILWVNPSTLSVEDSMSIDTNRYINQLVVAGSKLYVLFGDGVKVIDLASHALTTDPLFAKTYFGGYFDPVDNLLYLGTAKDLQNNDVVDVFDMSTHSLKKTLNVGIAPAFFAPVR